MGMMKGNATLTGKHHDAIPGRRNGGNEDLTDSSPPAGIDVCGSYAVSPTPYRPQFNGALGPSPRASDRGNLGKRYWFFVHSMIEPARSISPSGYTRGMAESPPTKPIKSDPSPGSELSGKPSVVAFGFDVLDRIEQAIAMVKERLRRAVTALEARGIPHAVVGGHAVAAWVARIDPAAVRTTVDVDLLVARADFDAVKAALESVGFIHSFTFGIDIFVDGPEGKAREAVHILFAGERVKPNDAVPSPDLSAAEILDGYRTIDLDRLVGMKLTAYRLKDRVHLLDMIDVGLIDAATLDRVPASLRPRLAELLANPDG